MDMLYSRLCVPVETVVAREPYPGPQIRLHGSLNRGDARHHRATGDTQKRNGIEKEQSSRSLQSGFSLSFGRYVPVSVKWLSEPVCVHRLVSGEVLIAACVWCEFTVCAFVWTMQLVTEGYHNILFIETLGNYPMAFIARRTLFQINEADHHRNSRFLANVITPT